MVDRSFIIDEVTDLAVSQYLDRYLDMDIENAEKVIERDWPQQMAILMILFLRVTHHHQGKLCRPFQLVRKSGNSCYVRFICRCGNDPIFGGDK